MIILALCYLKFASNNNSSCNDQKTLQGGSQTDVTNKIKSGNKNIAAYHPEIVSVDGCRKEKETVDIASGQKCCVGLAPMNFLKLGGATIGAVISCVDQGGYICAQCGNGVCDQNNMDENGCNCPQDCGYLASCNKDGKCDMGETAEKCSLDCRCGDGICDPRETLADCPNDCANSCLEEGRVIYEIDELGRMVYSSGKGCCSGLQPISKIDERRFVCEKKDCKDDQGYLLGGEKQDCCANFQTNWLSEISAVIAASSCTKCGDDICDYGETYRNCAADCASQCIRIGEGFGNSGSDCCPGLIAATKCYQLNDNNTCRMIDECYPSYVGYQTCIKCGNGVCGVDENKCNCPQDCGKATPLCGNYLCESSENYINCPQDCEAESRQMEQ